MTSGISRYHLHTPHTDISRRKRCYSTALKDYGNSAVLKHDYGLFIHTKQSVKFGLKKSRLMVLTRQVTPDENGAIPSLHPLEGYFQLVPNILSKLCLIQGVLIPHSRMKMTIAFWS